VILVINVCKESLHYFEFVKPVEDILSSKNKSFLTKNYKELLMEDIEKADKIIICGTALREMNFWIILINFLGFAILISLFWVFVRGCKLLVCVTAGS